MIACVGCRGGLRRRYRFVVGSKGGQFFGRHHNRGERAGLVNRLGSDSLSFISCRLGNRSGGSNRGALLNLGDRFVSGLVFSSSTFGNRANRCGDRAHCATSSGDDAMIRRRRRSHLDDIRRTGTHTIFALVKNELVRFIENGSRLAQCRIKSVSIARTLCWLRTLRRTLGLTLRRREPIGHVLIGLFVEIRLALGLRGGVRHLSDTVLNRNEGFLNGVGVRIRIRDLSDPDLPIICVNRSLTCGLHIGRGGNRLASQSGNRGLSSGKALFGRAILVSDFLILRNMVLNLSAIGNKARIDSSLLAMDPCARHAVFDLILVHQTLRDILGHLHKGRHTGRVVVCAVAQ